jgi:hypothetical protein
VFVQLCLFGRGNFYVTFSHPIGLKCEGYQKLRFLGVDLRFGHRTTAMRNYVNLAVPTMPLLVADKRGAAETKIIADFLTKSHGRVKKN